jgi:hypothetical protein
MDIFEIMTTMLSIAIPAQCVPVDSAPFIIERPGNYCLVADLTVEEGTAAIQIMSENVSVDLQGHKITGPGVGTGVGISASGVSSVKVFNGSISGFFYAVNMDNVTHVSLTGLALINNIFRGATVLGSEVVIEDSVVRGLTGFSGWPDSHTFGIEVTGPGCIIRRNKILDIVPFRAGEAAGISVNNYAENCVIDDNLIALKQPHDMGRYIGIWVGGIDNPNSVTNNVIVNVDYSLAYSKLSGLAAGNIVHERCSDGWGAEPEKVNVFQRDNYVIHSGQCSDDLEYLKKKVDDDPDAPHWHLRYGTAIRQELGNDAAFPSFKTACDLGAEEGCRLSSIILQQIAAAKDPVK